jgi:hypothetical protein
MKTTHIMNIGYPKCGTTWCWGRLTHQNWFDVTREKENPDLLTGMPVENYINEYNSNITANFHPANFALDRYIIKQLSELPTVRISIILRNSFDLYWSLFNFLSNPSYSDHSDYSNSVNNLIEQSWFHRPSHVIKRWQKYFEPERFQIFYYDEIQKDNTEFFNNYCKQMQLPTPVVLENKIVNKTRYIQKKTMLDPKLINIINQEIDNLQELVDRDLSNWKKYEC